MGFPLSTFQHLAGLCRDEQDARFRFSRYKVVAVVVSDPDDKSFKRKMKSSFERLHVTTGPQFAFITFIDPSENWKQEHRDWMEDRERLAAGEGCDDPAFFHALQDQLELPDSPCLVLTDDLRSSSYFVLVTSEDRFVEQMEEIGRFAESKEGRFPVQGPEFTSFIQTLGTVWVQRTADGRSLAANVADLVAIPALTGKGAVRDRMAREDQRTGAQEYVRQKLHNLQEELGQARAGMDEEVAAGILSRLSDYMALIAREARIIPPYADVDPVGVRREWGGSPFGSMSDFLIRKADCRGMEGFSWNCMKNYNHLLPLYFNPEMAYARSRVDLDYLAAEPILMDYSSLGICFCKAVEEEVNASVVQRLRGILGVGMPKYYRLFQDGLEDPECRVHTKGKIVKFNQKGSPAGEGEFSDRTIPLGDFVYATQSLVENREAGPLLGNFGMEGFLQDVYWFARRRNEACHNSLFDGERFIEMHHRFTEILNRYLPGMVSLKRRLRSQAN